MCIRDSCRHMRWSPVWYRPIHDKTVLFRCKLSVFTDRTVATCVTLVKVALCRKQERLHLWKIWKRLERVRENGGFSGWYFCSLYSFPPGHIDDISGLWRWVNAVYGLGLITGGLTGKHFTWYIRPKRWETINRLDYSAAVLFNGSNFTGRLFIDNLLSPIGTFDRRR